MNIRVDLDTSIYDGREVVFRSPEDCSQVTGLIVYYNGGTASQEFAFADAHGEDVGHIDHLFAADAVVKVILDLETGKAFVQNADTNAYLEGRFAEIENLIALSTSSSVLNRVAGDVISVNDSLNANLIGLSVYGKTTQNGTSSDDKPVELISVGKDGSIKVSVTDGTEENVQTTTVLTPNGLRGIFTKTTKAAALEQAIYVDGDGLHWICDEINFTKRMRITRIGIVDMGALSWSYNTGEKTFYTSIPGHLYDVDYYVLCDTYKATYTDSEFENTDKSIASYYRVTKAKRINVRDSDYTDAETFTAAVTGKKIMYVLKNPIETPLTEEELAQYASLHTYKGNTTISNDSGAGMAVEYVADTKTYIDNKFNELAIAIVNNA